MKRRLLTIGLLLAFCSTACFAAGNAATQDDLTAAKELHQKDVDALPQQVAAVDKRVDDQLAQVGQAVDRFSVQTTTSPPSAEPAPCQQTEPSSP